MSDKFTLLLWGNTQVGKTTLLATAFAPDAERIPWINYRESARSLSQLGIEASRLRTQLLTRPTVQASVDIELTLSNGHLLRVADIMGGITQKMDDQTVALLRDASVILFLLEWGAWQRDIEGQMAAIRNAWFYCDGRPIGLVFTKCERDIDRLDRAWLGEQGWWRMSKELEDYENVLNRFGDAVWATSSFGFDSTHGRPAVILGEFGQFLPYRIKPRNVHQPFEWALRQLGLE